MIQIRTMGLLILLTILTGYYGASTGATKLVNHLPYLLKSEDTIVGGYNTTIEEHPYQVYFNYQVEDVIYGCGGFIVSENYILSAGHCTKGILDASSIKLRAGSTWVDNGTLIPIAEVIVHPKYTKLNYDVGILKTAAPIQFTDSIKPVPLTPKGKPMTDGSIVTITGWGTTKEESREGSKNLLAVEVPVVNFDLCKKAYDGAVEVTQNMWCAGNYEDGGKDSCSGDSGGGAVQDGIAVGIVSFGNGCARPHYPGVYANIAAPALRDFIKEHTGL